MPQHNLYSIASIAPDNDKVVAGLKLDATHNIFNGHFPGAPVTPGVIQLQMVKSVLEQYLGRSLEVRTIRTCKFLEVLNPVKNPFLQIEIKIRESELLEVAATGYWEDITFFKVQATYQ